MSLSEGYLTEQELAVVWKTSLELPNRQHFTTNFIFTDTGETFQEFLAYFERPTPREDLHLFVR